MERVRSETAQDIVPIDMVWEAIKAEKTLEETCTSTLGLVAKRGLIEKYYNIYLDKESLWNTHHIYSFYQLNFSTMMKQIKNYFQVHF